MDNLDVIVKIYNNIKLNNSDLLCTLANSSIQDLVGCKIVNILQDYPGLECADGDDSTSFIIITECNQVFIFEHYGYHDYANTVFWKYKDNSKLEDK